MYQLNKIKEQSVIIFIILVFFLGCDVKTSSDGLEQEDLFRLQYGNFENEIQLFDLNIPGEINTRLIMKDGFFYISNGGAGKIMQLTSYGDLIGILYNSEKNPVPSFVDLSGNTVSSALEERTETSTQMASMYPFNNLGSITVDNNKNIYVTDFFPNDRFELDQNTGILLRQVVLRFAPDGSFIDYIGQEGPGGIPFPYIKKIYTTNDNELVVICISNTGYVAYWFSENGFLLYSTPIEKSFLPPLEINMNITLEQVIPDYENRILYVKVDYYQTEIDELTKAQSGIAFDKTLVYPLDISTNTYGEPISIPAYERTLIYGYTNEVFLQPYDFLGLTDSGWLFFTTADEAGFSILMTQADGQKIIRRHIELPLTEIGYHDFALSNTGILSAFIARETDVLVSWWRTDTMIEETVSE